MMRRVTEKTWPSEEDPRLGLIFKALAQAADSAELAIVVSYWDPTDPPHLASVYMNAALDRLLGREASDDAPRSLLSFLSTDGAARVLELHRQRMQGQKPPRVFEAEVVRCDGTRVPVELSTAQIALDGRPANVTFIVDVTHRKNAEEALRKSEARFRAVIEHAPDGVAITRWPQIIYVNPVGARMLGFRTVHEALGKDIRTLMSPGDADRADARVAKVQQAGRPLPGRAEYKSRDVDGAELSIEISSIPIEYEGGPAVLAFARDVTERRAMLAQLMAADKLAAVGTLAAGVAHEINNPLAYLLLNLEFLIRELPRLVGDPSQLEPMQRRLKETKQGAERVKTIVRDLQTFTRRDEGIRGPVDLGAAVEAALHMARHEIRHRANVIKNFEAIPSVYGNATRFEQLFLNLLINAAHAIADRDAPDSAIEIGLRPGATGTVIATVRDNGVGMPSDVLGRVFDPFFTTKPSGVGTGLGLPICHGIVGAVGGEIRVESTVGVGTTVTVVLPALAEEAPVRSLSPQPFAVERSVRGRVLLIDDERAVAEALAMALSDNHEVLALFSAAQARAVLDADQAFDVVLCDLVMPQETGMQLFDYVRGSYPELSRRFVFMTGGAFLPEADRFLQQVENVRIDKPFDITAVRALVRGMIK
jgi:PAS domain S-box-containing protein